MGDITEYYDIKHELEQLLYRAKYYNEPLKPEDIQNIIKHIPDEENHDDCVSASIHDRLLEKNEELEKTIEKLKLKGK